MPAFIIVAMVVVVIAAIYYNNVLVRRRREAFLGLAQRLGLNFAPAEDRELAARYGFLKELAKGDHRYACNTLSGNYRENEVLVFDYHYETHSTDGKGNTTTHHHWFSFFILTLPATFPDLTIRRENFLTKIAEVFGYQDIKFESAEFSKKFCVRCPDKKFAYDVCHAKMMEYLLANDDLNLEIENNVLALAFSSRLDAEQIEPNLQRLLAIRGLLPDYLFARN